MAAEKETDQPFYVWEIVTTPVGGNTFGISRDEKWKVIRWKDSFASRHEAEHAICDKTRSSPGTSAHVVEKLAEISAQVKAGKLSKEDGELEKNKYLWRWCFTPNDPPGFEHRRYFLYEPSDSLINRMALQLTGQPRQKH